MIIDYLGGHERDGYYTLEAQVTWEDASRPPQVIRFATHSCHALLVADSVEPFLLAALVPALWSGEKRIMAASPVCAQLIDNLLDFAFLQQQCFRSDRPPLQIEAPTAGTALGRQRHVAALFSGGVDSLFTLRTNHARHPPGDARRIVYGIWHSRDDLFTLDQPEVVARMEGKARRVAPFIDATGITLVQVFSNASVLWQGKNDFFWAEKWHGAGFAAAGHFLSGGIERLLFPSSEVSLAHNRWGSNPMTDAFLSSQHFCVRHADARHSRIDKLAVLKDWPLAMQNMKVCFNSPKGRLNCGTCEKCLRTRLAFVCIGLSEGVPAFPADPLTPGMFAGRGTKDENLLPFYEHLPGRLTALGFTELAAAVQGFYDRSLQMVTSGVMTWPVYWEYD